MLPISYSFPTFGYFFFLQKMKDYRDLPLLYNLSRCCVDVIALNTERRLTRDLILEAVPNSSVNILVIRES